MLLVYCEYITPRVEYSFHFILNTLCGFEYGLTSDEYRYCTYTGATLNYSNKILKQNDIEIRPNGLLFLQTIVECNAVIKQQNRLVQLFLNAKDVDASCFDLFAASFFLITRYEEYFDYVPDQYNRFEAAASILFKQQLLERPLIDEWAAELKQTILNAHPGLPFRKNKFTCKISIDVDQAFAFRHRGFLQNGLTLLKNSLQGNIPFLKSQLKTIFLNKRDPYDTFDYLKGVQQALSLSLIYFINAGAKTAYDKNLPLSSKPFRALLKSLKNGAEIGLHPSYFSDRFPEKAKQEKKALESVIGWNVTQSRQHYLKLYFPHTYQRLLALGITEDYTMGYASSPGFRAGTCTPFPWFDLQKNEQTPLTVFPVTYMEGTFAEDLKMEPEQAIAAMKKLTGTVRFYNGCHISIWHNHTVNDLFFWKGWKAVFEESLHYIIKP